MVDVAQICLNGHIVNDSSKMYPNSNSDFCDQCGKKTITTCDGCNNDIRGYHMDGVQHIRDSVPPNHCRHCGEPYPWTISKINMLEEFTKEFNEISDDKTKFRK